jgi:hypothetical protein
MVETVTWAMDLEPSPDIGWEITYTKGQQREEHQTDYQIRIPVLLPP